MSTVSALENGRDTGLRTLRHLPRMAGAMKEQSQERKPGSDQGSELAPFIHFTRK